MVSYRLSERVATIAMDDGKVNVLSLATQAALHEALDQAERDRATVLLTGRPGVFSAGFDLTVLRAGGDEAAAMARGGFDLAHRVLGFPAPVVAACTGHAIAMGAFLLLACDYRVGADGRYKLMANEVAIGLRFPVAPTEIVRARLSPSAFQRATLLSEEFSPANAVESGFLDRVVPADDLPSTALEVAQRLSALDIEVFAASKQRIRRSTLDSVRAAVDAPLD